MKKSLWLFLLASFGVASCATVQVQAPKEAIKMDIAMRLDVYQHVVKDIDDIESMVSGVKQTAWLQELFVQTAYASDLSPEVLQAIERRKNRRPEIINLLSQGGIGENQEGLLTIQSNSGVSGLVNEENSDRMIIYRSIAEKNGSSVSDVQKIYAERLQKDAPSGSLVETASGWAKK